MLVTQLRGHVPAVHNALEMFVWAMRRLEGQVFSFDAANYVGILPGSRAVKKSDLDRIHRDLILALILFEGCLPVGDLNPGAGHFKHYAELTKLLGPLIILWMMCFERYNKYVKSLVHDPQHPEKNLSISAARDSAAQFAKLTRPCRPEDFLSNPPYHRCVLWGREKHCQLTKKEFWDMRMNHNAVFDCLSMTEYKIAYIMGVHFRSGEWGRSPWCGSVITCVLRGHGPFRGCSLYVRVNRFFTVDGDDCPGYASVDWFSRTTYLFGGRTPLGVCVTEDGTEIDNELGSVIRITQIDPTPVIVERDGRNYMMMRDRGWDSRLPS